MTVSAFEQWRSLYSRLKACLLSSFPPCSPHTALSPPPPTRSHLYIMREQCSSQGPPWVHQEPQCQKSSLQQKADLSFMVGKERGRKLQTWNPGWFQVRQLGARASPWTNRVLLEIPVLPCTHMTKDKRTELGKKKSRKRKMQQKCRDPNSQAARIPGRSECVVSCLLLPSTASVFLASTCPSHTASVLQPH